MHYLKLTLATAGVALLAALLLWPSPPNDGNPQLADDTSPLAPGPDTPVATSRPAPPADHHDHHAVAGESEGEPLAEQADGHDHGQPVDEGTIDRSHWFEAGELNGDDLFVEAETSFTIEGQCDQLDSARSLEQNLSNLTAINSRERYPEALFYHALTQFWRAGDHYYQFVALWERDQPASYRYEFYRADDPAMSINLSALELPLPPPRVRSVIATNDYLRTLVDQALAQGASPGARIIESSPIIDHQQQHLTLVNGRVSQWQSSDFDCSSSNQTALCSCNQG